MCIIYANSEKFKTCKKLLQIKENKIILFKEYMNIGRDLHFQQNII